MEIPPLRGAASGEIQKFLQEIAQVEKQIDKWLNERASCEIEQALHPKRWQEENQKAQEKIRNYVQRVVPFFARLKSE